MSKRAYWIVRPQGSKDELDISVHLTRKEAFDYAERLVTHGWYDKVYVDRCYRETYAIAS